MKKIKKAIKGLLLLILFVAVSMFLILSLIGILTIFPKFLIEKLFDMQDIIPQNIMSVIFLVFNFLYLLNLKKIKKMIKKLKNSSGFLIFHIFFILLFLEY